jgi:microcompartment protein CcmL/EutN
LRALGVVESFSVASIIEAADAAVKATNIQLVTLHLAMAIGGKGFVTFTGDVASVEEAARIASAVIEKKGLLVERTVIAAPRKELLSEFI